MIIQLIAKNKKYFIFFSFSFGMDTVPCHRQEALAVSEDMGRTPPTPSQHFQAFIGFDNDSKRISLTFDIAKETMHGSFFFSPRRHDINILNILNILNTLCNLYGIFTSETSFHTKDLALMLLVLIECTIRSHFSPIVIFILHLYFYIGNFWNMSGVGHIKTICTLVLIAIKIAIKFNLATTCFFYLEYLEECIYNFIDALSCLKFACELINYLFKYCNFK